MKKVLVSIIIILFSITAFTQEFKYENGLYYKKGMLYTGTHTEYHGNGKLSIELNVRNGLEHGNVDFYFETGAKKEHREFNDGKKTGIWVIWDENGAKVAEASYKDDLKDGDWYVWNNQGIMLYEMHYTIGKKTGMWRQWDETGKLIMEREYHSQ
jgi:antitoxin component YwqK of YwqJK toxin-antitoxin module